MAGKQYPSVGEERVEIKQVRTTGGGVTTPVEGFSSDAGLGKPPTVGCYGAPADDGIPTGGKSSGGGNKRAMDSFFGKRGKA